MEKNMRLVSKEEFYRTIGPLDCHPRPEGQYPYTSRFMLRYGGEAGRIVPRIEDGKVVEDHYLQEGEKVKS